MRAGYSICDTGTGLSAALAVSAALYQRRNTNEGQYIDVAMLDAAISLASQTIGSWLNGGYVQPRRANLSVSHEPTSDVFQTAQGSLMLAIMRDEHVMILLRLLGLDQFAADPRFATREARVPGGDRDHPVVELQERGHDLVRIVIPEAACVRPGLVRELFVGDRPLHPSLRRIELRSLLRGLVQRARIGWSQHGDVGHR